MANNPYVNKVEYGNQTVMDISDSTIQESDVAEGGIFYKGTGQRSIGTGNYYSPNDTAETDIADSDYFPFYDTSAEGKRKTLWSNILTKIKTLLVDPIHTELTKAQYNILTPTEQEDPNKIYWITDDDSTNINWGDINGSILNQSDLINTLANITPIFFNQVLIAGNTSVTFTNLPTTDDYVASFYSSNGANYISIDNSIQGQVTVFYEIQEVDITICLKLEKIQ